MTHARDEMERAFRAGDLDAYLASFWSLRDACYRCAGRPRVERTLQDQRVRVERYVLTLCRDPEAFADLRRGPDTLLEACRSRDGEAAEAATRDALQWVLAELQRMLENDRAANAEANA
jgi:DNA-binding GntR family transcriptional regulator